MTIVTSKLGRRQAAANANDRSRQRSWLPTSKSAISNALIIRSSRNLSKGRAPKAAFVDNRCCNSRSLLKGERSEEHTSELQSLMRISYAVFCLTKKNLINKTKLIKIIVTYLRQL